MTHKGALVRVTLFFQLFRQKSLSIVKLDKMKTRQNVHIVTKIRGKIKNS